MESKYKERAIELVTTYRNLFPYSGKANQEIADCVLIDAMCQLSEEVEKESFTAGHNAYNTLNRIADEGNFKIYTKSDVEDLLQKQRELCYNKHKLKSYKLPDSDTDIDLIKDSILNAKLKLE